MTLAPSASSANNGNNNDAPCSQDTKDHMGSSQRKEHLHKECIVPLYPCDSRHIPKTISSLERRRRRQQQKLSRCNGCMIYENLRNWVVSHSFRFVLWPPYHACAHAHTTSIETRHTLASMRWTGRIEERTNEREKIAIIPISVNYKKRNNDDDDDCDGDGDDDEVE